MRKFVLISCLLSSFTLRADYKGEAVPVEVNVDEAKLAKLSPESRALIEQALELIKKELTQWKSFDVRYPESKFAEGSRVVELSSLFRKPDDSELERLAVDENGKQLPLSDAQMTQLRKDGIFVVPSKKYPGQNHVWKLSLLLQKGDGPITVSYQEGQAWALGQFIISVPERFSADQPFSVGRGLNNIFYGFRGILSNLVGLVEERRKYNDYEIDNLVEEEKHKVIAAKLASFERADGSNLPVVDARLYDEKLTKQLQPVVDRIRDEFTEHWLKESVFAKARLLSDLQEDGWKGVSLEEQVQLRLEEKKAAEYQRFLTEDEELESLSPGYGKLLKNHDIAVRLAELIEAKLVTMIQMQEEVIRFGIKTKHPVRSKIPKWLAARVQEGSSKFYREVRWDFLKLIPLYLEEWGLNQEAYIYWTILDFQQNVEADYRRVLADQRQPSRTFTFEERIWNSDHWGREEYKYEDEPVVYFPITHKAKNVTTNVPFWRLQLIASETKAEFKNGLYRILVSNLYNGPVGLHSMFGKQPFYAENKMVPETGDIVPDEHSLTGTFASRWEAIWKKVREGRETFEAEPDTGFLGKKYTRWLNTFWNYGVKGFGASSVLVIGQPVVTVLNLGVSVGLTAAAPVWAPMSSMFKAVLSTTIYDVNSPGEAHGHENHRWFPLMAHTVGDIGVAGLGQTVTAAGMGAIGHPLAGGVYAAYNSIATTLRKGWDHLLATQVILKNGRLPVTDSWLAKRIAGPGISSNYFFQLRPEIALLALQAKLEAWELTHFGDATREAIEQPYTKYETFFSNLLAGIASVDPGKNPTTKLLLDQQGARLKELEAQLAARHGALRKISQFPVDPTLIRQSEEDQLVTLNASERLVAAFYRERIVPYLSETKVAQFWNARNLLPHDFPGLTKALYKETFSPDFLIPLEESDEYLVIEVKDEAARLVFAEVIH
ncbi:MAG: hypothetical protein HYW48_04740 [Deltaproteobacteria bacterium]|nr:hypothetical protein [Deltaproteobacteria bacterium]